MHQKSAVILVTWSKKVDDRIVNSKKSVQIQL